MKVGPGAYNLRESDNSAKRKIGITLKCRTSYDQSKDKKHFPGNNIMNTHQLDSLGPGSYHTLPSLISPSFNILAKSSLDHRIEILENHVKNFDDQNQGSQTTSFSLPTRPSSHPRHSSRTAHNHRMIFDASSMLPHQKSNDIPFVLGGAAKEGIADHCSRNTPIEDKTRPPGPILKSSNCEMVPTAHLHKEDVKSARKLFRGILQSTHDILSNK